tara:strand:- start:55 stop:246 length:192 start_codon:yes stop_codon:yes gene_type:complete
MAPSEQCKQAGLESLAELQRVTGESKQTLINWHKNKPILFEVVVIGAAKKSTLIRNKRLKNIH